MIASILPGESRPAPKRRSEPGDIGLIGRHEDGQRSVAVWKRLAVIWELFSVSYTVAGVTF